MAYNLFWDIDGTLLTTGRAGIIAWEDAAREILNETVDFSTLKTAGLTDVEIAAQICRKYERESGQRYAAKLLEAYERRLPDCLPQRAGKVLDGVIEVLEHFSQRRDVYSLLLTGNTRRGAKAKLSYYGLDRFFPFGAFADGCGDRPSIARKGLQLLEFLLDGVRIQDVFIIGDTPHDISCGKAIGAKTIAVASGVYDKDQLASFDPWLVLDKLPPPADFEKIIGID